MKVRISLLAVALAVAILASACGAGKRQAPWPERAGDMASRIERAVTGESGDAATTATVAANARVLRDMAFASPALYDAAMARRSRLARVQETKAAGLLGENNKGLLAAPSPRPSASPDELDKADMLAGEENASRLAIYRVAAKDLSRRSVSDLTRLREVWAAALRGHARAGEWFQAPRSKVAYDQFLESELGRALVSPPLPGQWGIIRIGAAGAGESR